MEKILLIVISISLLCSCSTPNETVGEVDMPIEPVYNDAADYSTDIGYLSLWDKKSNITMTEYAIASDAFIIDREGENESIKIDVKYPKIVNAKNVVLQNSINQIIRENLIFTKDKYEKLFAEYFEGTDEKAINVTGDYFVSFASDDILSVKFWGKFYIYRAAHPTHMFTSVNIDMKTGEELFLNDIVTINDEFVDKIKEKDFTFDMYDDPKQKHTYHVNDKLQFGELAKSNEKAYGIYIYLTPTAIGISFQVPYALGGHKEFEVEIRDIEPFLKIPKW